MRRLLFLILRRIPVFALAFLAGVLLCAFLVAHPPIALVFIVSALFLLTLVRPTLGWLAVIAIGPFGDLLGRLTALPFREFLQRPSGWPAPCTEPMVLAFLAGWLAREALRRDEPTLPASTTPSTRLALALACVFALIVTASMAAELIVQQVSSAFPLEFGALVWRFLWHDYFLHARAFRSIPGAAYMLEGIALFAVSAVVLAREPGRAVGAVRVFAMAATGVAAVNLGRLLEQASEGTATLSAVLTERIAWAFPDVNAAGSYFVMALFVTGALARSSDGTLRRAWLLAAALTGGGLWFSGSRTAFVSLFVVGVCSARRLGWKRHVPARFAVPALLVLAAVVAALAIQSPRFNAWSMEVSVRSRIEMAKTALRMSQEDPVLGVGPGLFYYRSHDYIGGEWRSSMPRENAHNNFLQVLAELGALGLASLLALVTTVIALSWRQETQTGGGWSVGVLAALLAFVFTWTAGHPLVTREVALAFWTLLGLASVSLTGTRSVDSGNQARCARATPPIAALFLAILVPTSAAWHLSHADLTRAGRGFSQWHRDTDGTRFRWMLRRAVLYLPASARTVAVPVRAPGGLATVRALMDGKQVGQVVIDDIEWRAIDVDVPKGYSWASVPVTLLVRSRTTTLPTAETRIQVAAPRVVR